MELEATRTIGKIKELIWEYSENQGDLLKTAVEVYELAVEGERRLIGGELEKWMDDSSPYRRIAQAEHAITKLKQGNGLINKEVDNG